MLSSAVPRAHVCRPFTALTNQIEARAGIVRSQADLSVGQAHDGGSDFVRPHMAAAASVKQIGKARCNQKRTANDGKVSSKCKAKRMCQVMLTLQMCFKVLS